MHQTGTDSVMALLAAALVVIQCCLIDKVDFKEQVHVQE